MSIKQITKIATVSLLAGFFSPSLHLQYDNRGITHFDVSLMHTLSAGAAAALGGGGHAMHIPSGGGMHMPMGISRPVSMPTISRPVSIKPVTVSPRPVTVSPKPIQRPVTQPSPKPVTQTNQKPVKKPEKTVTAQQQSKKPQYAPDSAAVKPRHHKPHYVYHPHHTHHHGHHYHYPYHGWDPYWDWFWASNIVIGAIVSVIPDNECQDVMIEDQYYKECNGVLFEPVPQEDGVVQYEVVDMQPRS